MGKIYNASIEDEVYYAQLIDDVDFKDRSVLSIICNRNFAELMSEEDPKAENLIMKMWKGKFSTCCDGNVLGYSNMIEIFTNNNKPSEDPSASFM